MSDNFLKEVLVKEGITQAQLAREAGVSAGTVNKVCSRSRDVAPTTRNRLVVTLNRVIRSEKYRVEDIFPDMRRVEL